jgi:hypothetical protein
MFLYYLDSDIRPKLNIPITEKSRLKESLPVSNQVNQEEAVSVLQTARIRVAAHDLQFIHCRVPG